MGAAAAFWDFKRAGNAHAQYQTAIEVSEASDLSKIKNSYEESFQKLRDREIDRGVTLWGLTEMIFFSL